MSAVNGFPHNVTLWPQLRHKPTSSRLFVDYGFFSLALLLLCLTYPFSSLKSAQYRFEGGHMDEPYHLKIKLFGHEFEASGPVEVVQVQFEMFKELVTSGLPQPQKSPTEMATGDTLRNQQAVPIDATELAKIMNVKERTVSLTVRAESIEDSMLLIILGQRVLRNNELTTGGEIMDGLSVTGGIAVGRIDRLLEKIAREGHIIVTGARRSKRYRLTNSGLAKAREIAAALLATVA
jgi:hypothetical protein